MRMGWGLAGVLAALTIVAVLARKQVDATRVTVPAVPGASAPAQGASDAIIRVQGQQVQRQIQQQVESLMQQPRPMPDEDSK